YSARRVAASCSASSRLRLASMVSLRAAVAALCSASASCWRRISCFTIPLTITSTPSPLPRLTVAAIVLVIACLPLQWQFVVVGHFDILVRPHLLRRFGLWRLRCGLRSRIRRAVEGFTVFRIDLGDVALGAVLRRVGAVLNAALHCDLAAFGEVSGGKFGGLTPAYDVEEV